MVYAQCRVSTCMTTRTYLIISCLILFLRKGSYFVDSFQCFSQGVINYGLSGRCDATPRLDKMLDQRGVKYCCTGVYAFTRFFVCCPIFRLHLRPTHRMGWRIWYSPLVIATPLRGGSYLSSVLSWHTERKADKLGGICFCWTPLSLNFQPRIYFRKIVSLWFLTITV